MGKQAGIRALRRVLRDRVALGVTSPAAAESTDRRVRGRLPVQPYDLDDLAMEMFLDPAEVARRRAASVVELAPGDAADFHVGMSISGPPEVFGLPPDPGCGAHTTGTPGCTACYPPRAPMTVTAVDYQTGTITLATAAK